MTEDEVFSDWVSRMDQQWADFDTYNDWKVAQDEIDEYLKEAV